MSLELKRLFAALMFFTRIPCSRLVGDLHSDIRQAAKYLPLIGILVGAAGALVTWLALSILPHSVAILLGMVATALLTGAIHEDGFADSCDGFGGGWRREQVLKIMQDSRIGSFGAVGLALLLLLKLEALSALPENWLPLILIAGHSASRLLSVSFMYTLSYIRPEGTGKAQAMTEQMSPGSLAVAALFGLAPLAFLPPFQAMIAVAALLVLHFAIGRYFLRRLGGYTGDCLGAAQQAGEVIFYITLLATL